MLQTINKELIPIKAHYFLYNAATGPIVPFLPTIAKQLGFSGILVGTIYTILPITGLIAKPLFGGLAAEVEKKADITLSCESYFAYLHVCSENGFSDQVMHSVITESLHSNSSCQLTCEASKEALTQLCFNWNETEFCNTDKTSTVSGTDTFEFTAGFDVYKDLSVHNCIDIRVRTATFPNGAIRYPMCNKTLISSCTATCDNIFNQMLKEAAVVNTSRSTTYHFHLFLWATIISWIGMAVVVSIADAICFELLGNDRRKEYGKQKMFGSIGFGIFGISAGYLVDIFSEGKLQKDYSCIFYIMLVAMIFDIVVSSMLKKKNTNCSEGEPSLLWELLAVCKDSKVLVFAWWCIGAGMCTGVVWNFLFWYTEDLAATSDTTWLKTLQGLLTGVQCFIGELPFNFISGNVLRKLGHINVMNLVLVVYAIRFMAYSVVTNPWLFLFIEILHGPTLGLCWPTMVSYGDKITPSGTRATMQGFIGAVFEGIGVSSGSFLCGWLMDTYKGVTTFRVFSVGALLWLAIFWLMHLLLRKVKAYPLHQGHNHLANYANPDDAILMTISQELQTY
ncbi:hypothetical protein KM043_017454 [Ampulex compressa]|nr:hypothetical protein KM043_017454 [Ampulex compressa]